MISRRQKRTAKRTDAFWAARHKKAHGDPAEQAAVRFDQVRAAVCDRHAAAQPALWGRVCDRLADLVTELDAITDSDISGKEISSWPAKRG